jgi:hypothetical protein
MIVSVEMLRLMTRLKNIQEDSRREDSRREESRREDSRLEDVD